jgi:hypothetical protein
VITCIAIGDGRLIWARTHRPVPAGRLRLSDRWVVYDVAQDGQPVLCFLDVDTGAWAGAIETTEPRPIEELFLTLEGHVVMVTSQSILAYDRDVPGNHPRWRVRLEGHLRRTSLLLDLDAMYLSDDGRQLQKIALEDGRVLWVSERLIPHRDDDLTAHLVDGSLIVSTASSVSGIDAVTGLTLWRGTTPERSRFIERMLTRDYLLAVDVPEQPEDGDGTAFFFDHRNASGVIPREGGTVGLGRLVEVKEVIAADGALLIQAGSTIHAWTSE